MKAAAAGAALLVALATGGGDRGGEGRGAHDGSRERAPAHDFVLDVLPHLQRLGCSSAYCHGSATGQGGFRLSLFGGDPLADYAAIVQDLGGRRIDLADPERSLLVQKALGRLDHGGGRRLPRDGEAHGALLRWLAAGAPWREGTVERPRELVLAEAAGQLVARARGDGVDLDVTGRALFLSSDPRVAEVTEDGAILRRGAGRAHAIARFGHLSAVFEIVQPFAEPQERQDRSPAVPSPHPLDQAWSLHLHELGLEPVAAAEVAVLARRLHLDLVGRPPTPAELARFVAEPDVAGTVRALSRRPEFAEVWGGHLARWFELPESAHEARARLVAAIADGLTLRGIAERVARGGLPWIERHADPRDRAEYAARTLLGTSIGCARCHDHPGDRWRQADHLHFAAAFAPARAVAGGGMGPGVLFDDASGEPVPPRWLDLPGTTAPADGAFATFVLDPGHGLLARNFANRVFAELFGRGLVEPLDDHRAANPPLAAGVLETLAAAFDRVDGSLPDLLAFVTTSRLYALASLPPDDPRAAWLAARAVRPLSGAAFARAVGAVLGAAPPTGLADEPLARELELRNGPFLAASLAEGGVVDALFLFGESPAQRLDGLWRTTLSRPPRAAEQAEFQALADADLAAFRDLAMALLLGREFGERR